MSAFSLTRNIPHSGATPPSGLHSVVGVIEVVQTPYVIGAKALDRSLELVVVAGHVQLHVPEQSLEYGDPMDQVLVYASELASRRESAREPCAGSGNLWTIQYPPSLESTRSISVWRCAASGRTPKVSGLTRKRRYLLRRQLDQVETVERSALAEEPACDC